MTDSKGTSSLVVTPWDPSHLDVDRYDLFVATLGFEQRSRFLAEIRKVHASRNVASAFDYRKEHAYARNKKCYERMDYEVVETSDDAFRSYCSSLLATTPVAHQHFRVCIDISSMSRFRLATWISMMRHGVRGLPVQADFLYAPAVFSKPPRHAAPITVSQPVLDEFAGWSTEPDKPLVSIIGLGYEPDKAVGALEYLEPADVWAFRPSGEDRRYEVELEKANSSFWGLISSDNIIDYDLNMPFEAFTTLESLSFGVLQNARPVLVPFGPKLFSLCCLLVACVHHPSVSVWRVSSGHYEPALNRVASGKIVGVRVMFTPSRPEPHDS